MFVFASLMTIPHPVSLPSTKLGTQEAKKVGRDPETILWSILIVEVVSLSSGKDGHEEVSSPSEAWTSLRCGARESREKLARRGRG